MSDIVTADLDKTEILSASFALVFTDPIVSLRDEVQGGAGLEAVDVNQDRDSLSSWDQMVYIQVCWENWLML